MACSKSLMRTAHQPAVAAAALARAVGERQKVRILVIVWRIDACHALRPVYGTGKGKKGLVHL